MALAFVVPNAFREAVPVERPLPPSADDSFIAGAASHSHGSRQTGLPVASDMSRTTDEFFGAVEGGSQSPRIAVDEPILDDRDDGARSRNQWLQLRWLLHS